MTTIAKNIVFVNDDLKEAVTLQTVLDGLNAKIEEEGRKSFPTLWEDGRYTTLTVEHVGSKYIKIIAVGKAQRSVYCFLDYAGRIYRSATWRAPAKHARGSIFQQDFGWGTALGPYGAAYLR